MHLPLGLFLLASLLPALLSCTDDRRRRSGVDAALSDAAIVDATLDGPASDTTVMDVAATDAAVIGDVALPDAGADAGPPDVGVDSGPLMGVGSPPSCSSLDGASCTSVAGCRRDDDCGGFPEDCFFLFNQRECEDIEGCTWSVRDNSCDGFADSCFFYNERSECEDQGCDWEEDCRGDADSCASFTEATCTSQSGCRLE